MLTAKSSTTRSTIIPWPSMPIPGKRVWETQVGDIKLGETTTMAPIVVRNMIFTGISGGELGVRGRLVALDLKSGKISWRAYSTGPDQDTRIGPGFKAFYPKDQGQGPGPTKLDARTNGRVGGGAVWGWVSYDPELNLIYYGTGNAGVWNRRYASRRQQVVYARSGRVIRKRVWRSGPIKSCLMTPGIMTRSWKTS